MSLQHIYVLYNLTEWIIKYIRAISDLHALGISSSEGLNSDTKPRVRANSVYVEKTGSAPSGQPGRLVKKEKEKKHVLLNS